MPYSAEELVDFAKIKHDIISNQDLFQIFQEKCNKYTQLLRCFAQAKAEIKKINLEKDMMKSNLNEKEKIYKPLQENYDKLKAEYNQLENEHRDVVTNLHIKYQQANLELEECKTKLHKLDKAESQVERKKTPPRNAKKTKHKEGESSKDEAQNVHKIAELILENKQLQNKLNDCKHENNELTLEVYRYKKQLKDLDLENGGQILNETQEELKLKQKEIADLKDYCQKVESEKCSNVGSLQNQIDEIQDKIMKLKSENEELRNENCVYKLEVSMLQHNNDSRHKLEIKRLGELNAELKRENLVLKENIQECQLEINTLSIRLEECMMPSDAQVSDIFREMVFDSEMDLLSPIEDFNPTNDSTVGEAAISTNFSPTPKHVGAASGCFKVTKTPKINPRREYRRTCRNRRRFKRKSKKNDLLRTLLALKKANIHFTISSEPDVSTTTTASTILKNDPCLIRIPPPVIKRSKKKLSNTFTSELKCDFDCCNDCNMLLKGTGKTCQLLGFVNIKTESDTLKNIETINDKPSGTKGAKADKFSDLNMESGRESVDSAFGSETLPEKDSPLPDSDYFISNNEDSSNLLNNEVNFITCEEEGNFDGVYPLDCSKTDQSDEVDSFHDTSDSIALVEDNSPVMEICDKKTKVDRRKRALVAPRNKRLQMLRSAKKLWKRPVANVNNHDVDCPQPAKKRLAHSDNLKKQSELLESKLEKNTTSIEAGIDRKEMGEIQERLMQDVALSEQNEAIVQGNLAKTVFKRPICRIRQSARLLAKSPPKKPSPTHDNNESVETNNSYENCPASPPPMNPSESIPALKIIPLEKIDGTSQKMATTKMEVLFEKVVSYSMDEVSLNEVVGQFTNQDPDYIVEAILERVSKDCFDTADNNYSPAPLMTLTQRSMLGFMSKLEKTIGCGIFEKFLLLAEKKLLSGTGLRQIAPITRLYLAICKLQHNLHRMRRFVCDFFYFCGDLAVPFLFVVLSSWTEVLPHAVDTTSEPLARVLVQIVYMKDCNKPGYNLMPLRDLLIKFYQYPTERWDSNELFSELYYRYMNNPVRSSDFAILLLCKYHPEKWVNEKIDQYFKPLYYKVPQENFKANVIILIGNLSTRFSKKSKPNYLLDIRKWMNSLARDEATPDLVKRSLKLCFKRLKGK